MSKSNIKVTIAGVECAIVTLQSNLITCNTAPYQSSSITAPVLVYMENNGYASSVILFLKSILLLTILFIQRFNILFISYFKNCLFPFHLCL